MATISCGCVGVGYDLDLVANGICLCKQHHWAFDEGLLQIAHDGTNYSVTLDEAAIRRIQAAGANFSIDFLRQHLGVITAERLPTDPQQWPNRRFLEKLRETTY